MTGIWHNKTCCHIERSGLAGTIRSQQSNYLPLSDIDGHIVHHSTFAILFDEPFRTEHHTLLDCIFVHYII